MNIAIVAGIAAEAASLQKLTEKYAAERGVAAEVTLFHSAKTFLSACRGFTVAILDCALPDGDGVECACALRRTERTVSVIFVSSRAESAVRGYDADAEAFLLKPVSYESMSAALNKAETSYLARECRGITLRTSGGLCRFSADRLMYVEVLCHKLIYHFVDSQEQARGTLAEAERSLAAYGFLRCGYSFLVNPRYICRVEGRELYVGGTVLAISRNRRGKFMEKFCDWLDKSECP